MTQKRSILDKHLEILEKDGLTNSDKLSQESQAEARFAADLKLPPLRVASKRGDSAGSRRLFHASAWSRSTKLRVGAAGTGAVVLAASLLLTLRQETHQSDLRVKGQASLEIAIRREGSVTTRTPGEALRTGDQFRIGVLSPSRAIAYFAVYDDQSHSLSEFSSESSLHLRAGMLDYFSGSLTLDARNVHETLVVAVCSSDSMAPFRLSQEKASSIVQRADFRHQSLEPIGSCHIMFTRLR